jgi:hypothetical protein
MRCTPSPQLRDKQKPPPVLERTVFYRCSVKQFAASARQNHISDQCRFVAIAPVGRFDRVADTTLWTGVGGQIMSSLNFILVGAIAMATVTTGVFFLRFWAMTKDRFFLFFAAAFLIEGVNRFLLGLLNDPSDDSPIYYAIRLLSYGLIVVAIIDKNLPRKKK